MTRKTMLSLTAALLLCAPAALAQGAPPPGGPMGGHGPMGPGKGPDGAEMAKMHAQMCQDGYAQDVGRFATLEVRLQLTDKQKPLFERWKALKLKAAKAHAESCAAMNPPEPPDPSAGTAPKAPDPVEGLKREEARLKARLADLKAEIPAFEALCASLSDEQKHALTPPPGRHGPGGPGMRGPGMRGPGMRDQGGPGKGGPGAPPPQD